MTRASLHAVVAIVCVGCGAAGELDAGPVDSALPDGAPPDSALPDASLDTSLDGAVTSDAGTDVPWYLDEAMRAAACDAVLAERRERCGELFCFDDACPAPGACGDVYFDEDSLLDPVCEAGEVVEDSCGRGCLSRRGGAVLCGPPGRRSCGPEQVCAMAECVGFVAACEPRPTECAPEESELACTCDGLPVRDRCATRQDGVHPVGQCNFLRPPCGLRPLPERGDCESPVVRWAFDGERCVGVTTCSLSEGFPDQESCQTYRESCPSGTVSSGRMCRDNSVCDPREVCLFPPEDPCGRDGALGRCQQVSNGCFRAEVPEVCGCDGVTYPGACAAIGVARIPVDHTGPCDPRVE